MPERLSALVDLRDRLAERFPTLSAFDAFCLDHFPEVHRRFGAGMERLDRENLLLAEIEADRLCRALDGRRNASSAPPPNNLPVRNATFVGRVAQLDELHRALTTEGVASVVPRQVYGLGGVGKTSLALEYAYRHASEYPGGLWWVRAEGKPEDALVVFAAEFKVAAPDPLKRILERVPDNAPSAEIAQAVKLALQNHALPSLLVLDNLSANGWRSFVPAGAVRVLVTTRDRNVLRNVPAVHLESLTAAEARELADRIAGQVSSASEIAARDRVLHTVLGNLAVAVDVAARGMTEWGMTWSAYESLLASQPERVLEAEDARGDYPRGAIAALDLSIERTGQGTPARRLLEGAAVFAPEAIPREWAVAAAGLDDELSARQAAATLRALGLLRPGTGDDCFDLHRLVRLIVRTAMAREENVDSWRSTQRRALHSARDWMEATVDIARLTVVEARRQHVEALVESTQSVDERAWCVIADRLAMHLRHRAEHVAARRLLERALQVDEAALGPGHTSVATRLSNLALALKDLGDAEAAKPLLERALNIAEATLGPEHPNVAISLSNLAIVMKDLGDATAAKPMLERALRIDEATSGPEPPNVAIRLSNLAMVLLDLGDAATAKPLLERALRIAETTLGPEHPNVAISLSNLAMVLKDLEGAASAKPLLERALRIGEATFGPEHPKVAIRLSNLAIVLRDLGDVASAKSLLERALTITEARLGPDHPRTKTVRAKLTQFA